MFDLDLNQYMVDMVYELVPGVKRNGDKLNFKCPICGDSHKRKSLKRGWFYIKTGSVFCWNAGCPCNSGMSGLQFLALVSGKSIYEVKTELIKRAGSFTTAVVSTAQTINLFDDLTEKKKSKLSVSEHILDADWVDQLPELASKILITRKIYKAPYLYGLKFYYNKHSKRLVIPWSDTYWQERALLKSQEETEGKYLFPFDEAAKKPIYGLENLDNKYKNLFLLEGIFDSIFVKNGCALGSLKMSNLQEKQLEHYANNYNIILFPDNQYKDESSYITTMNILKNKPFQKIFIWPKELFKFKDVNDTVISSDNFIKLWSNENFLNSRIFNGITGILELKK